MPSLMLSESCPGAPNTGTHTLAAAVFQGKPVLVAAVGDRVDLLDENCNLVQGLPLQDAFPPREEGTKVEAVAVDISAGQIAAVSEQRVAIWAQRGSTWRVHSSFKVPHAVAAIDFVQCKIAVAGEGVSLYELDERGGFPVWSRFGSLSLPHPATITRLSPSASVLATVTASSSTVLLHSVESFSSASSSSGNCLRFRSRAAHSVRIRSIGWRSSDDIADSGPVLFTLTVDGAFRIWGSMIDEPSFFSLWATLDVHASSSLPKHLPVTTLYWRTTKMDGRLEGTGGTKDEFVTVYADGGVGLTTVSNFDSRPPTCLSQHTVLLQPSVFPVSPSSSSLLPNLRHPFLLPSRSSSSNSFHLIGRCSRSTLVHARAVLPLNPDGLGAKVPVFRNAPTKPTLGLAGEVRRLVSTERGDAVLAIGEKRVQSWAVAEGEAASEAWVAELREEVEQGAGVATWRGGRMLAIAQNDTLRIHKHSLSTSRVRLLASTPIHTTETHSGPIFSSPLAFFAARSSEDSPFTTLVYVSRSGAMRSFVFTAGSNEITSISSSSETANASIPLPPNAHLNLAEPIPPPPPTSPSDDGPTSDQVAFVVVDSEGTLYRWEAGLTELEDGRGWILSGGEGNGKEKASGMRTGLKGIERVAVGSDGTSAIVSLDSTTGIRTLSIWDPKASEFSSGKQFSQELPDSITALSWSHDDRLLAVASASRVDILCAQRFDDLSGKASWSSCATIDVSSVLPAPLTALSWLSPLGGLCLAASSHLFFYTPRLDSTSQDLHELAEEKVAPLPLHHPQLLFQAILQGHFDAVVQILSNLAAELTDDGHLTPLPRTDERGRAKEEKLTLKAFLTVSGALEGRVLEKGREKRAKENDLFSALTTSSSTSRKRDDSRTKFSEDDAARLISAIRKRSLRGLSKIEHEHLAVLAQTVVETYARKSSIDENGLRFLVSLRSFYLYQSFRSPPSSSPSNSPLASTSATLNGPLVPQRLKYRDMLWAFHSESQDLLLDEATKACGGKLTWERARTLGLPLWIKSTEVLSRTMEQIGRTEFQKPDADERDPISATLFYLALKKKHVVLTFWKQSSGYPDQRQMLKFLANDFSEQRWKTAACKNAYALMSKQRFHFAAAFFLLGSSLKDAVCVILRQLDDFPLAIAVARTYEGGDDGPVLRSILEEMIVPLAFRMGYRWLGSWAFWLLGRRDLAVQIIITPLPDLARHLPYKLDDVQSPPREDPALVLLFAQLRSWSLQTVKGAIAVLGKTEFGFVLHIARILCRMGCHVLALNLLRNWRFLPPSPRPVSTTSSVRRPNPLENRRQSLLLSSTKLDLPLPSSALPSRATSPGPDSDAEERERQREQFRSVVNTVKVETKSQPAEFSLDAFGF
ncbi:hypothetical protein JCM8547_002650 [Rhodosporidiobolus lusitaniae]